jgi:hypothetical protein
MLWAAGSIAESSFGASYGAGHVARTHGGLGNRPGAAASKGSSMGLRAVERQHNRRLKQTPRVDYGMNLLSARRCLAATR